MYSPQLLWECTKKDSSFVRKPITPNLPWMSANNDNLTGVNSYKFSGLTAGKTVGLYSVKNGKKETIILATKAKKQRNPKGRVNKTGLSKSTKKGLATIDAALAGKFYRKDLLDLAKAKYAKLKTSFKKKKAPVSSRREKK
eukprot:TRINITY_DN22009_c0_g2_i1.p2 TRINITY_DN22009_c0_g2~~TRINITY_DN22009_c0_g2_i1.p2  ORF type:complete len:141 (-),score=54.34 TRINITY_DN22009_c0_g2_i1:173-595(-)